MVFQLVSEVKKKSFLQVIAFHYSPWILESIFESRIAYWGSSKSFNLESNLCRKIECHSQDLCCASDKTPVLGTRIRMWGGRLDSTFENCTTFFWEGGAGRGGNRTCFNRIEQVFGVDTLDLQVFPFRCCLHKCANTSQRLRKITNRLLQMKLSGLWYFLTKVCQRCFPEIMKCKNRKKIFQSQVQSLEHVRSIHCSLEENLLCKQPLQKANSWFTWFQNEFYNPRLVHRLSEGTVETLQTYWTQWARQQESFGCCLAPWAVVSLGTQQEANSPMGCGRGLGPGITFARTQDCVRCLNS